MNKWLMQEDLSESGFICWSSSCSVNKKGYLRIVIKEGSISNRTLNTMRRI